jgi:hypothetical protein
MSLLLTLLMALGITVGICLLLILIPWAFVALITFVLSGPFRNVYFIRNVGIKDCEGVTIQADCMSLTSVQSRPVAKSVSR